ncbi:MAG: cell division protein ZapA [Zymomonas mobilis subsp. pomaceae]|uniref:cell division protein ZapA n=1 Tax=Zymomonas mobilis TaxID=542 RepID=UPI0039EC15B1
MAQVDVMIGGRSHQLACRDGDESRLRFLANIVDGEVAKISEQLNVAGDTRRILLAALLLADKNEDIKSMFEKLQAKNEQLEQQLQNQKQALDHSEKARITQKEERNQIAVQIEEYAERIENIVNRLDEEAHAS